jgi:hypothetical protein
VRFVDVGRTVEDGQHQPAAEEQLHVRPQGKPDKRKEPPRAEGEFFVLGGSGRRSAFGVATGRIVKTYHCSTFQHESSKRVIREYRTQ